MEDFENANGVENPDGDIGVQVNNCCEDCARLDARVTVAERDIEYMQNSKADKFVVDPLVQDVEWMKANKAEKTTTDRLLDDIDGLKLGKASKEEVARKADISQVNVLLAEKADKSTTAQLLADIEELKLGKADKSALEAQGREIAAKADRIYVDSQLGLKADRTELEQKADTVFVQEQLNELMQKVYPVGSYYFSASSVNPATVIGFGTWRRTARGRVLVGVDESDIDFNQQNKLGGSKNLQAHAHIVSGNTNTDGEHTHTARGAYQQIVGRTDPYYYAMHDVHYSLTGGTHKHAFSVKSQIEGTGNTENLQPYLTCYIWERTA